MYIGRLKGSFLQSHQDNSKYTQQYGKHRKVVKFSVAGVFACVLLGAVLTLSAFSTTHMGVGSAAKPQVAVSANTRISHQIHTRNAVSSVTWRQFHQIDQVFGAEAPTAVQIATCESGLNPNAYNPASIGGSHAAGLFQILYPSTWYTTPQGQAGLSPYDAMANIQAAHSIFVRDGYSWREWTCQ